MQRRQSRMLPRKARQLVRPVRLPARRDVVGHQDAHSLLLCESYLHARSPRSPDPELRLCICRIAAATRVLAAMMAPVTPQALTDVADAAVSWGVHPRDMVAPAFLERLTQRHAETDT
jgi:hypothetical protein